MKMREEYKRQIKAARQLAATWTPEPIATCEQAQSLYDLRSKILELAGDPENRAEDRAHSEVVHKTNVILAHLRNFQF